MGGWGCDVVSAMPDFSLSPLLAHTCMPDRCKSFISIHIVNEGGVGWGGGGVRGF
jgi:hypothetical protein